MTHTQGRLTWTDAIGGRGYPAIYLDGDYIGDAGYNRPEAESATFTAELVRRWNAFEEGGAVAQAIEALRAVVGATQTIDVDTYCPLCGAEANRAGEIDHKAHRECAVAEVALAALEEARP